MEQRPPEESKGEEGRESRDIFELPIKDLHSAENVIILEDVRKEFKLEKRDEKIIALSDFNLEPNGEFFPIKEGEFVVVRGPSGGGKTTLLNVIGSIENATAGIVTVLNSVVNKHSSDAFLSHLRLEKIGFVFQTFNLLATMTAFENVELPMRLLNKLNFKERRERAKDLLRRVGLGDRLGHLPSELSGGEQQRVAIARALANKPAILLLDEPTGDLDSRTTIEVMNLILSINRFGPDQDGGLNLTTCLLVTHNPHLEIYADRILYVQDGKLVKQVLNSLQQAIHPDHYVAFLKQKEDN